MRGIERQQGRSRQAKKSQQKRKEKKEKSWERGEVDRVWDIVKHGFFWRERRGGLRKKEMGDVKFLKGTWGGLSK